MKRFDVLRGKNLFRWPMVMLLLIWADILTYSVSRYAYWYYYDVHVWIALPLAIGFTAILCIQPSLKKRWDVRLVWGFIAWYIVVLAWNRRLMDAGHQTTLYNLLLFLCVYFLLPYVLGEMGKGKAVRATFLLFSVLATVLRVFALYAVWTQQEFISPFTSMPIGFGGEGNARLMLFEHPNSGGCQSMLLLLLSIYLFLTSKRGAAKIYHVGAGMTAYLTLALTDSRTSMIGASIAIGLLALLFVRRHMHTPKPVWRWAVGIGAAGVAAAVTLASFSRAYTLATTRSPLVVLLVLGAIVGAGALAVWGLPKWLRTIRWRPSRRTVIAFAAGIVVIVGAALAWMISRTPPQVPADEGMQARSLLPALAQMGGRMPVWRASVSALRDHPSVWVHGVAFGEVIPLVQPYVQGTEFYYPHTDNAYLNVLLATGVPGMLLWLLFIGVLARFGGRLFLDTKENTTLDMRFLPAIVLACVVVAAQESFFVDSDSMQNRLFFLISGYMMWQARGLYLKTDAAAAEKE